jgi:hypothetical protein
MKLVAIYAPPGPEAFLTTIAEKILPPGELPGR